MVNYSLNRLVNLVETISEAHPQINAFAFSEKFDINAEHRNYPLLWCNVLPASISGKTMTIELDFIMVDKVQDDNRNERDTLSDTLQIVGDLLATFGNPIYQDYFNVEGNTDPQPVRHALTDVVNGWRFQVRFQLAYESNRCQVPQAI